MCDVTGANVTQAEAASSALLIIDMISDFNFPEAAELAAGAELVARRIHRIRGEFHRRNLPVIYANDNFANWKADFRELVSIAQASTDAGQNIVSLLRPTEDDYFVLKPKHSAFLATALPVLLAKLGVRTLYLTGMAADSCVLATAMDANAREYRVRVVSDAIVGNETARRQVTTLLKRTKAAEIVNTRTLARSLG